MREPIEYRFALESADFYRIGTLISFREGGWMPGAAHLGLILVVSFVPAAGLWSLLAALFGGLLLYPLHRYYALRSAGRGPLLVGEGRLRFDADGYSRRGPGAVSEGQWSAIEDAVEAPRHLILRFGSASILPVSHAALAPLSPAEAKAQIEQWMAGDPGGAAIECVDQIDPGAYPALFSRANRRRAGHRMLWPFVAMAGGLLLMILLQGITVRAGWPAWTGFVPLVLFGICLIAWMRREGRGTNTEIRESSLFDGPITARFDAESWGLSGADWGIAGLWSDAIKLWPMGNTLVLRLGPMFFLPIPGAVLAPDTPRQAAARINGLRGR